MAYRKPSDLDGYIALMPKADMRVKAILAEDLVTYLSDETNSLICQDLGLLIDGLIPWLTGSHFKISQKSLEAFTELIKRLGPDFNAYTSTILPHVIDRLGDSKDTVREKAQLLLHNLMEFKISSPQHLIDKLTICFKHKNAKVREEFLQTILNTLNEYGTTQLSLKAYILPIVNLLSDPTAPVRDAAIQTLVEIYKHVGDRLRIDLRKKEVPSMKMAILEQKFDEIREEGLLLKTAYNSNGGGFDESDNATVPQRPTRLVKRNISASTRKPQSLEVPGSGDAGAVTVETFEASFEVVPTLTIFTQRDVEDLFKSINVQISDKHMDWEKRVDSLKKIRSLLMMNVQSYPNFPNYLKDLSIAFLDILKELRSQVIREACITLAYMSKILRNKLDLFCIYILQELINLVPNSAKIISSSAIMAFRYILKYTHVPKIIPILTSNLLNSKSKDIRSTISELLNVVFEDWQTKTMERSALLLRDALKKGIVDADNDARKFSRRAFWGFKRHFPELADQLYGNVDISTQRALERERELMNGNIGNVGTGSMNTSLRGSNSSLNSIPGSVLKRRTSTGLRSPAASNPSAAIISISTENLSQSRLSRAPSLPRSYRNRSGIPVAQREFPKAAGFRSISAVDAAAAQRARARAQYSNLARMKVTSGTASLQGHYAQQARAKKIVSSTTPSQHGSPEHHRPTVVPRSRGAGVSQSQPTSRSTSPSSKLREMYGSYSAYKPTGTVPKKASGIPRSLANSRETSPTRGTVGRKLYANSPRRQDHRPPINPGRPVLAQKILQQSREAESALADALSPDDPESSDYSRLSLNRKISREESDESEASSVCSERSFDSFRRGNDSYSWNGSRSRLDSFRAPIEDIEIIIQLCASTHWSERKDGLISLTDYLSNGKTLTPGQLQCVLDMFRKMFMDTHTKVYALFLSAVDELIIAHSNDLHDWLFILLTRLFNKLGTELLGSMHGKIWNTLKLVHEYFPADLQMHCVFRILVDSAQTPPTKTKIATLKFLTSLAQTYCSASDFPTQGPVERALLKIVQLATDQKSAELRAQARLCLIALYNCNTPNMTKILSYLPKNYQDTAHTIIAQHLRRTTSGTNSPSSSPLSCSSPKPLISPSQGPFSLQDNSSPRSRQSSVENPESLNSEEVYKSLRKTTAEIQNYSFETKLDRDANSKDSGISQMGDHLANMALTGNMGSCMNNIGIGDTPSNGINGHLGITKDESCNGSRTQSATTTESNTPESTVRLEQNMEIQNQKITTSLQRHQNIRYSENGEIILENGTKESDIIKAAIVLNLETHSDIVLMSLSDLAVCIKYGNCELPNKNFKAIMKMLLNLLESPLPDVMILALQVVAKIIRSEKIKPFWNNFLELILLKIIDCYKNHKEVAREIDILLPRIAYMLPVNVSVNILNPVIATGSYPINLCAIKLLTELADKQGNQLTDIHLDTVMPNLARSTDDLQSMVRKAAVFCIVKLYIVMGEDKVKPRLNILNPSKIRLLNVYIDKAKSTKS